MIEKLTVTEHKLISKVLNHFTKTEDIPALGDSCQIQIDNPISDVHKYLLKILKKDRPTITAIKLSENKLEEVKDIAEAESKNAEVAATTPIPKRGCPMPVYNSTQEKEIRATRVLVEFLNPTQLRDFNTKGCFVVRGIDSKHRMLVCHRWSKASSEYGLLHDLDNGVCTCIDKTDLPPAEELLSLLFMLSCKGREKEWRVLNDMVVS